MGHKLQSTVWCCALLYCSGCCAGVPQRRVILGHAATQGGGGQQFGSCSPHSHTLVLPVPVFTLAMLWTSPCSAGIAGTRLAGAGPGELRAVMGARGRGCADWQREGEGTAWEPSRGPRAGAASGGVNIAPTHGDVTWGTVTGPMLRLGGLVALL